MAIYTKTGDKGETKVFDKKTGELKKVSKTSCQIATIGTLDELNSFLGVVNSQIESEETKKKILEVQSNLFVINSILAGSNIRFPKLKVKKLEKQIDDWEGKLPVLKNFIYYSGVSVSTRIFYARAISRRAERELVALSHEIEVNPTILAFVNRLSDYLFMLGRYINFMSNQKEVAWRR